MQNPKKLAIHNKSISLCIVIYDITKNFPNTERFGLISQMRRCSVSVPSNISEGCGRATSKDFSRFLDISLGSLCELLTQVEISNQLNFIDEGNYLAINDMIENLIPQIRSFKNVINERKD